MEDEKLLTLKETCKLLRVSRSTLFRLVKRGEITARKVGSSLRFYESDIKSAVKLVERARHQVEPLDTEGY